MARSLMKNLTAAIRAPFRKSFGLDTNVANSANSFGSPYGWSYDNTFEQRWRNAAGTDDVRALSVDAANNVKLAGKTFVPRLKPLVFNIPLAGVNDAIDQTIFVAPGACRIAKIVEIHQTAESTATTATLSIEKLTGTTAAGSGTSVMTGTFNLKGTAVTLQTATLAGVDSDDPLLRLAAGDRLGANFTYTGTAAADDLKGVQIVVYVEQDVDAIWLPFLFTQAAGAIDQHLFVADRDFIVTGAVYSHSVKSSGACKLMLKKCSGATETPAASTALLLSNNTNTGFDVNATANTVQTGTLHATTANLRIAPGNTIAADFGTTTGAKGVAFTVVLEAREDLIVVTNNYPHNTSYDDQLVFTADRNYEILSAAAIYTTADASGNVQLTRDTGTTAAGAGTDLLSNDTNAGWDTDAVAAATTNVGTFKDTRFNHLMATDRLGIDFNGQDALVGFTCTVVMKPE